MEKKMKISDVMSIIHKGISENLTDFSGSEHDYRYKIDGPQSKNTSKVVAARLNLMEVNGTIVSKEPVSLIDIIKNNFIPVSSRSVEHLNGVVSSVICGKIAKTGDSLLNKGALTISFGDSDGSVFNISQNDGFYISSRSKDGVNKNNGIHSSIKEAVFESCLLGYTKLINIGLNNKNIYSQENQFDLNKNKTKQENELGL